ncbi:MAG: hypothetical protein QM484_00455 [Woeseiaceae bacterium]
MAAVYFIYSNNLLRASLTDKLHQIVPEINSTMLYQWKNAQGKWQITDKPPQKGIIYKTVSSHDQINVITKAQKKK